MGRARDDRPVRVLHLSDMHFRASKSWDADPVLRALTEFVGEEAGRGLTPDLVAITGDLAFSGRADEYRLARAWLDRLWEKLGGHLHHPHPEHIRQPERDCLELPTGCVYETSQYPNAFQWIELLSPPGKRVRVGFGVWHEGAWKLDKLRGTDGWWEVDLAGRRPKEAGGTAGEQERPPAAPTAWTTPACTAWDCPPRRSNRCRSRCGTCSSPAGSTRWARRSRRLV